MCGGYVPDVEAARQPGANIAYLRSASPIRLLIRLAVLVAAEDG
jgi:hypothetical protein